MSSATPPCANLSGASRSPFRALAISDRHQNGTLIAITTECRSGSKRNSDRHHPGTLIGIVRNPQFFGFPDNFFGNCLETEGNTGIGFVYPTQGTLDARLGETPHVNARVHRIEHIFVASSLRANCARCSVMSRLEASPHTRNLVRDSMAVRMAVRSLSTSSTTRTVLTRATPSDSGAERCADCRESDILVRMLRCVRTNNQVKTCFAKKQTTDRHTRNKSRGRWERRIHRGTVGFYFEITMALVSRL